MTGGVRATGRVRREQRHRSALRQSLQMLHSLGFAPWAIEYYRQEARREQKLPHEIVRGVACGALQRGGASPTGGPIPRRDARSNGPAPPADRRAPSLAGLMRRQGFEQSLALLSQCGFEGWAVEAYRQAAREVGMLPHDLVRCVAESCAWYVLNRDPEARRRTNGDNSVPGEAVEIPAILLRKRTS